MTIKGFRRNIAPLQILSDGQVENIRLDTLRVLEKTGVVFAHDRALAALAEAGCLVDYESQRVRFPSRIVEEALSRVPREPVVRRARLREFDIETGDPDSLICYSSCGMDVLDFETGQSHRPTRKEFYDYVRVLDSLPTVHVLNMCPYFSIARIPAPMTMIESCAAKIRMSGKAQGEGAVLGSQRFTNAMARELGFDLHNAVNPLSPLTYDKGTLDNLLFLIDNDLMLVFFPGALAGTSAPASLAGAMVVNNAEILAGIVLAQVLKPGRPINAGTMIMTQNMRSGGPLFGSAATLLLQAALCQVWRTYGVDFGVAAAGWTDSKMVDYQAGNEITSAAVLCALAGANYLLLHGGLSQEMTAHPAKAVLDDDLARHIERLLAGVEVDDESLAVEVIDKIGPSPGNYLGEAHTRKWYRKEGVSPLAWDLEPFAAWDPGSRTRALDRARDRVEQILATHETPRLSESEEAAVEGILGEAREYYRSSGLISDKEWAEYQEDLNSPGYPYA